MIQKWRNSDNYEQISKEIEYIITILVGLKLSILDNLISRDKTH